MKKMLLIPMMIVFLLALGGVAVASESGAVLVIHNETSKTASVKVDYVCNYGGEYPEEGKRTYSIDASGGELVISDMIDSCLTKTHDTQFNMGLDIQGSCNSATIDINGYFPANAATNKCSIAVAGCIDSPLMVVDGSGDDCLIEITYK